MAIILKSVIASSVVLFLNIVASNGSAISDPSASACVAPMSADADRVFEGVEKRIELRFIVAEEDSRGLRAFPRSTLDGFCDAAKCAIIHTELDTCFDSYILSESSLFVFRDRLMIKTCGTTLPLDAVPIIISAAVDYGFEPLDMTYSRSSFVFPDLQLFPHDSLDNELEYLDNMSGVFPAVLEQKSLILGSTSGPYWLVHTKRFSEQTVPSSQVIVDCIMTGLSANARSLYWKDNSVELSENDRIMSRTIESIDSSLRVVGKAFDPCGFSANAHGDDNENYMTVHVTPEESFSYASVEAVLNNPTTTDVTRLIENVIGVFSPEKLIVTILARVNNFALASVSGYETRTVSFGEVTACATKSEAFSIVYVRPSRQDMNP